jgi:cellulose synthase/poly-beta-1,6-N-acetylglucosamine synthase-like glycosyltransferase
MFIIEYILLAYFLYSVSYTLLFSLAGRLINRKVTGNPAPYNKIAVLIPAYKEDAVIESVAKSALKQDYPQDRFDVVVIADSLMVSTVERLRQLPIKVVEVSFEKSTKVKSLNVAMAALGDDYDMALILDADNIMETGFLKKINYAFNGGNKVIQTRRVAKNMNTSFAVLDALSEIINNHIYRKGHHSLGMSSSLIGSGMAFDYKLLKYTMLEMDSVGGFDRELEVRLVGKGHNAIYLENAIVFDEKVEKPEVFANQRRRWISSQFIYLREYFWRGIQSLFRGDLVYFNSSVLRNIHLPRVINLGLLIMVTALATLLSDYLYEGAEIWWILTAAYFLSFIVAVPLSFYSKKFFVAVGRVPQAFFIMFLSLFRLKGANKQFIHTPHGTVDADPGTVDQFMLK